MVRLRIPVDLPQEEALAGQFAIALTVDAPSDWKQVTEHLAAKFYGDSETVEVLDQQQNRVGLLVGTPIDVEAQCFLRGQLIIDIGSRSLERAIEEKIYRLAGSFVFVLDLGNVQRIYLDACGTMPIVYDPKLRVAGSSAGTILTPTEYAFRFNAELYEACGVAADGWLPGGATPHQGVERLMVNHYLDLSTWTAHRHWRLDAPTALPDIDAILDDISDGVHAAVVAVRNTAPTILSLTAGHESRLILACCRDFATELRYFTVTPPEASVDREISQRLSATLGLRQTLLLVSEADEREEDLWHYRAGHQSAGINAKMHPTVWPLAGHCCIGGLGGEVGRGFLWLNAHADTPVDAGMIVDRLKLPRHPVIMKRVDQWLHPLKDLDTLQLLDLAYIELRMGSWGFGSVHANPSETFIHPLISRRMFELMLALPPEVRRNNGMILRVVERRWPQLLEIPINRYGDYRDRLDTIQQVVRRPGRAYRKVRQLVFKALRRRFLDGAAARQNPPTKHRDNKDRLN